MTERYFDPYVHNGRWLGRWLECIGVALELAGLWVQKVSADLRWRRLP